MKRSFNRESRPKSLNKPSPDVSVGNNKNLKKQNKGGTGVKHKDTKRGKKEFNRLPNR